jgi:hypothetical protein
MTQSNRELDPAVFDIETLPAADIVEALGEVQV